MEVKQQRIVVWCGSSPNQKALANKIAAHFPLSGIVIDSRPGGNRKRRLTQLPALIVDRMRFKSIYRAWTNLMDFYDKRFSNWPVVPFLRVRGINNKEVLEFTDKLHPDLVVVSGTALIKEPLLSIKATIGIINLHTGLSPYVKGGPNCTNWCIANNSWSLVGNTIMWLNAGIDAGNIITTEAIDIRSADNLKEAHIRVMEHAHDLYLRTIEYLLNSKPPFQSINQKEIAKGELFLTKMWTSAARTKLLKNWSKRKISPDTFNPVTVPLPA